MVLKERYSPITEEVQVTGQITHEKVGTSSIEQKKVFSASITEKVELTSIIVYLWEKYI